LLDVKEIMLFDVVVLTKQACWIWMLTTGMQTGSSGRRIGRGCPAKQGLHVTRKAWDDPDFDWQQTRSLLFRTTWDYFDRYAEFSPWLRKVASRPYCSTAQHSSTGISTSITCRLQKKASMW
jgi:hypothetical protein